MADNFTLPAVGSVIAGKEMTGGEYLQQIMHGIFPSASNTTTTPLSSAATYTGTGEIAPADGVVVSCKTDNTGTLYFDFSPDGTNWDAFPSNGFVVASGIHEYHSAKVNGRYFRARLVNDTGAQTYLRLYTYFTAHTHPSAPLNQTLGADADAMVTRTLDPIIDMALGRLGGVSLESKFGYARELGTGIVIGTESTWVDLWAYGGKRTSPTTSFTPYMASDSTSDTDVDVTWVYQDANGVEQTVEVNTNGQTGVSLGVTATEVYRGYLTGTNAAVGNIACTTANNFTSGVPTNQNEVLAYIGVNDGQTQVCAYRVPANKKAIIRMMHVSMARNSGAAGSCIAAFETRDDQTTPWRNRYPLEFTESSPVNDEVLIVLDAGADFRIRIRDISDTLTSVRGDVEFLLVDV